MIRDNDLVALLDDAAAEIDVPVPPAEALVDAGRRGLRRRRVVGAGCAVAVTTAVAVGVPLAVAALRPGPPPAPPTSVAACVAQVPDTVLPRWARAGFTGPSPRIAYVRGHNRDMVAVLFAQPLTAPPSADHNNKILWVARPSTGHAAGTLRIDARLADGSATAVRTVPGGPGPSIIDLPKPGCWHLTLHWAGRTDSLDLAYAPA